MQNKTDLGMIIKKAALLIEEYESNFRLRVCVANLPTKTRIEVLTFITHVSIIAKREGLSITPLSLTLEAMESFYKMILLKMNFVGSDFVIKWNALDIPFLN